MRKHKKLTAYLLTLALVLTSLVYPDTTTAQADTAKASASPVVGASDADVAMSLAQTLVGSDITVTSAKLYGDKASFGTFQNGDNIIGFGNGIILSNGQVFDKSPNLQDPTKWNDLVFGFGATKFLSSDLNHSYSQKATDPALADALTGFWESTDIAGNSYNDPTMLEFTFIPKSDTISFQYVMASEEYPQYINSFQDKFMLNVNGVNYAVVPGTNGAATVTIGNINHERFTAYYRGVTSGSSQNISTQNRISEDNFSFNGETTVLSVDAKVTPNQISTVRVAVADKNDGAFDTAVFIKANSVSDKQVLYGSLNISAIDKVNQTITITRVGGSAGYVSADVVFYASDNTSVVQTINVPFGDGETQKVVSYPVSAYSASLTNPIGGVKLATTDKTILGNAYSSADLSQIVASVSGSAFIVNADTSVTSVSGCSVSLKQGNTVIATTLTDEKGAYNFNSVSGGYYNIVVKSPTKSGIGFVKVDQPTIVADTIYLYGNVDINLGSGAPDILIKGLPAPTVDGTLSVNVSALTSVDLNLQSQIENGAYKLNGNVALVLDFTLVKDGVIQTTLPAPIIVTFDIPPIFQGKDNYYIYQIHDKGGGVLTTEVLYDCDNDPATITVQISSFSTFTMIYTGTAVTPTLTPTPTETPAATVTPTTAPTPVVSIAPTVTPAATITPTTAPTPVVSTAPTVTPTSAPTPVITTAPTAAPTTTPTRPNPTTAPTITATPTPTAAPTVSPTPVPSNQKIYDAMKDISLSSDSSTIYFGGNYNSATQVSVKLPSVIRSAVLKGNVKYNVKYYTSNAKVAAVSNEGLVSARGSGSVTVNAAITIDNRTIILKYQLEVKNAEIIFTASQSKMSVGDNYTFTIQCNGYNPKDIVWKSTRKNVVTVSLNKGKTSAVVTAKTKGTDHIQIRVYNKDGKIVKYNFKVKVK